MSTPELGRLEADEVAKPIILDESNKMSRAILTKLDECIDRLNAIGAAIEAATDGDTLQAQLDVAAIKSEIKKLQFHI